MQPDELKEWRTKLGLTQEEAGQRLGVSRVAFRNWESGGTPIPLMVDAACERQIEQWRRRPEYGPVALIYADGPMWGLSGRIAKMQREIYPNNEAALNRARQLCGTSNFHNPLVVDEEGHSIWNFPRLREEIEKRIDRERAKQETPELASRLHEIACHFSSLPVLDDRTDDEIVGYDEHGLPR
jgi:hypothetical protein